MAERSLRALLLQQLDPAGLSFPAWTVLVFLDSEGPLRRSEVIARQLGGLVVPDERAARVAVEDLHTSGLLASDGHQDDDDPRFTLTPFGEAVYRLIRGAVNRVTDELFQDLPQDDLEATRRTLTEVAQRAGARLAGPR